MKKSIYIRYKETVHLTQKEISDVSSTLAPYFGVLKKAGADSEYTTHEAFSFLPSDTTIIDQCENLAERLSNPSLKYVVVVGIGGSNLGASALYDAVYGRFDFLTHRSPKLIFADTTNAREMAVLKKVLEENVIGPKEIVLNIITKSGTTVESLANAMFLLDVLSSKIGEKEALSRTVVTTDEGSPLWEIAKSKDIATLSLPKNIGGRYSVFSCVGIFPLRLCGVMVRDFLEGARDIRDELLLDDPEKNPALLSAVIDFLLHKNKLTVYNSFFFHSELESLGKWGRQLFAESLGKKFDTEGNVVNAGMTPIVSIGSTDLHSMVQLYLGGPRDKMTNFIYCDRESDNQVNVPQFSPFKTIVPDITGKDFQKILSSILGGTLEAYKEKAFPYIETVLPRIDEYSVGQYMMLKMFEVVLLAKLWHIDPFDQPEVESYKKVAKELLVK